MTLASTGYSKSTTLERIDTHIVPFFLGKIKYFLYGKDGISMNEVQIFNNPDFGEIRTVMINGEPYFVGIEVAKALGYAVPKTATAKHVDSEDRLSTQIEYAGQNRDIVVINESGLYSLIFGSKLESAKKFKKWVTSEVLPCIRKHGTYQLPQSTDGKIALLAQGHQELRNDINELKEEVENIKSDLPILPLEAYKIEKEVRRKGVETLGGKKSPAYNDRGLRQKLYNDLYTNLKHNFDDIRTYKAIRRKDAEKAIRIVNEYKPPLFLAEQIESVNAQQTLELEGGVCNG